MTKKSPKKERERRPSLLKTLFARQERDQEYMSDLNSQWEDLDDAGKTKFVIGAVVGLILFVGALALVFWAISAIMN